MAVTDQTATFYAGNRHVLSWPEITGDDGDPMDPTGKIAKFALCAFKSDGVTPNFIAPLLDFSSDDVGSPVTNTGGDVEMEFLPEHTEELVTTKDKDFYFELELYEADESFGVVVATGTVTVKANVVNA